MSWLDHEFGVDGLLAVDKAAKVAYFCGSLRAWALFVGRYVFLKGMKMAEIVSQYIQGAGCSIHMLTAGSSQNLAIVLLHGMKFQALTWQDLGTLDFLANLGVQVAAVDMPGFGKSPACDQAAGDVLQAVLAHLNVERVVLVGPSMGGRLALEYAIAHPGLTGLVLVGAVGVEENRSKLHAIAVPTLLVWGADDQVSPLANSEILLQEIAGASRIIFPGAPHPCYLDQPDRWHESLQAFINQVA